MFTDPILKFFRPIKLLSAALCASGVVNAAELPDGPGKAELVKLCVRCHSLDMATSLRQGEARWAETLSKMVNLGAEGSQEQLARILKYLAQHFGPRDGGKTPDPTAPAGTLEPGAVTGTADAYGSHTSTVASKLAKIADSDEIANVTNGKVPTDRAKEWWTYGHDSGAMRFSPLKKITPDNVRRLKVAWGVPHASGRVYRRQ